MDIPLPETVRELIAVFFVLVSSVLLVVSCFKTVREHTFKLFVVCILFAITLFANHLSCYIAALFIVAAQITKLEFLQNILAIICRSDSYFRSHLSQKEIEKSRRDEAKIIEAKQKKDGLIQDSSVSQLPKDLTNLSVGRFASVCEEHVFRYFEEKYENPVERHVQYRGKGHFVTLDGVMKGDNSDLILEIKVSRRGPIPYSLITQYANEMVNRVREYRSATSRNARVVIVLVGFYPANLIKEIKEYEESLNEMEKDVEISFLLLNFREIGLG